MWSPSDTLLAQYLAGDCTDAEARDIERWAAADPRNRARLDAFRTIATTPWPPSRPTVDAAWIAVRRTIRPSGRKRWRAPLAPLAPLAAAAGLAVAAGAGFLWHAARGAPSSPRSVRAAPMRQFTTPRGQRATFQLSDGTRLILAAESRLRVPTDYGRSVREVFLDGEAVFDVVHDSTRPFRVHAKDAAAEDLGTRFDVRAYPEDSVVTVAVVEGLVALGPAASSEHRAAYDVPQGVLLRQGEVGTLASDGRVTTAAGAAAHLAWTEGRLHFAATPLPEVARAIGRWYGLDVRVEGQALMSRTVTAEFEVQSADELLQTLASALGARVSRAGQLVRLRSK